MVIREAALAHAGVLEHDLNHLELAAFAGDVRDRDLGLPIRCGLLGVWPEIVDDDAAASASS